MRWHQAVDHGKAGHHGQADQDQRSAGAPGDGKSNRYEQNEAYLKEDRQAHDQRRAHHGPGHVPLAEKVNQGLRDAVRGSGFRHHLAQHGAQANHDRDVAEGIARPRFEGGDNGPERHPGRGRQRERNHQQREKRVQLAHRDEQNQPHHCTGGGDQQEEAVAVEHRRKGSRLARFSDSARAGQKTSASLPGGIPILIGQHAIDPYGSDPFGGGRSGC